MVVVVGGDEMSKYRYLTYEDRKNLEAWYSDGVPLQNIADRLNVHISTVYRELERGCAVKKSPNTRPTYSAEAAQRVIKENFKQRGNGRRKEAAV